MKNLLLALAFALGIVIAIEYISCVAFGWSLLGAFLYDLFVVIMVCYALIRALKGKHYHD